MGKDDKLIKIASYNTKLNHWLGTEFESFAIYRSKGLLTHLINRKHFVAAKLLEPEGIDHSESSRINQFESIKNNH